MRGCDGFEIDFRDERTRKVAYGRAYRPKIPKLGRKKNPSNGSENKDDPHNEHEKMNHCPSDIEKHCLEHVEMNEVC